MQGIGVCILIPLAFLVPRREDITLLTGIGARADMAAAAAAAAEAGTSLEIADTDAEIPIAAPVALSAEAADLQQPLLQAQDRQEETHLDLSRT